jgi:hypothetical protein
VLANAGKPQLANNRAEISSQGFGTMKYPDSWSFRKAVLWLSTFHLIHHQSALQNDYMAERQLGSSMTLVL